MHIQNRITTTSVRHFFLLLLLVPGSGAGQVVINEVYYHVDPSHPAGDANNDGVTNQTDDEFVEIANGGLDPVDVSQWRVVDGGNTAGAFIFPDGTVLQPLEAATIFNGGAPMGIPGLVYAFRVGNGYANTGGTVELQDENGLLVDTISWTFRRDLHQSIARSPDFSGDFADHSTAMGSGGAPYSPGRTINGIPLADGVFADGFESN